jgi:hypothetical protein
VVVRGIGSVDSVVGGRQTRLEWTEPKEGVTKEGDMGSHDLMNT